MGVWQTTVVGGAAISLVMAICLIHFIRQSARHQLKNRLLSASLEISRQQSDLSKLIASGASLEKTLEQLLQTTAEILPGCFCFLVLLDTKDQTNQAFLHSADSRHRNTCEALQAFIEAGIDQSSRETTVEEMDAGCRITVPVFDAKSEHVVARVAFLGNDRSQIVAAQAAAQVAGHVIHLFHLKSSLESLAARYDLAENVAAFGIWDWNPTTGLFDVSAGLASMASATAQNGVVTGQQLYTTVHPDDRDKTRQAREAALISGGRYQHEFRRITAEGGIRWYRNNGIVQLKDGKPARVFGTTIEITEQKLLQFTLEEAKREAEAAARAKGEFLSNMSHEIRTPMNAVMGMTELLLDQNLPPEAREYIDVIRTSSELLLVIINDILDFSKIESGKLNLEYEPVYLPDCVEEVLDLLANQAAQKQVELTACWDAELSDWIFGDLTRLKQILLNLVGNAIKFTDHGEVAVTLSLAGESVLRIAVRDTGIGIPEDKIKILFQSFIQADTSTTRRFGGSGLGLAISRRLIQLMGGTIWVTSEPGVGSVFSFEIPYEPAPVAAIASPLTQNNWVGKSILIVDDNETNRLILCSTVKRWGLDAQAVDSAQVALETVRTSSWDAVLLDWRMPVQDGAQLAFCIREELGAAAPPLILLSSAAAGIKEVFGDSPSLVAIVLPKPVRRQALFRALSQVFNGSEAFPNKREPPGLRFDKHFARQYPLRILLADDNPVNQKVAVHLLAKLGYCADTANDGFQVLAALQRQAYDLILMDVQMPKMDGLEATRRIISQWGEQRPWITALTAGAMQENRDDCLSAGVDDFLTKPIHRQTLEQSLKNCSLLRASRKPETILSRIS